MTINHTDVTGQRFGQLVATEKAGRTSQGATLWSAQCDCGAQTTASVYHLRSGHTTSCGCRQSTSKLSHGDTAGRKRAPEFLAWSQMHDRCRNPNHPHFKSWGGRGIRVCERWNEYQSFLADMGRRPSSKHSLDRIDVNGDYGPENCRWATKDVQQHNRRATAKSGHQGISKARNGRFDWSVVRGGERRRGRTKTIEEAIAARANAAAELYEE